MDHNTSNDDEIRRLAECGLDPNKLRHGKRLGMQQNTRSIGDHSIKGGYKNVDILRFARVSATYRMLAILTFTLRHATSQPGIADPYVNRPIDLSTFHGFLILMSDGLYEAYEAWTRRPDRINEDIAHLVAQELTKCPDLKMVAQNVVDKVRHLYRKTCKQDRRSGRLDDITLVVKSLIRPIVRTQSEVFRHHHHPQMDVPPTAPITDKQFQFSRPQAPSYGPPAPANTPRQPPYWGQQSYPNPPPPASDYSAGGFRQPNPFYLQQPDQRASQPYPRDYQDGDPGRGGAPYYTSGPPPPSTGNQQYHPSMSTPGDVQHGHGGGGGYPPPVSNAGDRGGYREPPPTTGYHHPTANQPPPSIHHTRQGSDHNRDEHTPRKYENVPQQNTTVKVAKPPAPDPPKDEVSPPPLPPRNRAEEEEEEENQRMYGWQNAQETPPKHPPELEVHKEESPPKDLQRELQYPPQDEPEILVEGEEPGGDNASNGAAGVVFYDEEYYDEEPAVVKEDDPPADGSGTIQPYIKFNDHFPVDLSWSDIKIAT